MWLNISKCVLYYHTIRHLKLSQICWRIYYQFYKPLIDDSPRPRLRSAIIKFQKPIQRHQSLLSAKTFYFLNQVGDIREVGWNGAQRSKLWRYNQHYFDDLNAFGAESRSDLHKALLDCWMKANKPTQGVGWDPYPTSLRLVNWVKWYLVGNRLNDDFLQSIAVQTRWLLKKIEWHILGNHLFANAKALVFSGLIFDGLEAKKWLDKGLSIVTQELNEQILPDGGNFERSPMYHSIFLEDLLDLINICNAYPGLVDDKHIIKWRVYSLAMLKWLKDMCHPDGEISFFNDASIGVAPTFENLEKYANRLGLALNEDRSLSHQLSLKNYLDSGYVRLENKSAVLILDVGAVGPNYQPGHAHADTFSFELSLFGERVFVNCGVSEYGNGQIRQEERSTFSHNTVEINKHNSSEVWSGFRVARRASVYDYKSHIFDDSVLISCVHDGYSRLNGSPQHQRIWQMYNEKLVIQDQIHGIFRCASSTFHLHPNIKIKSLRKNCWLLKLKGMKKQLILSVIQGDGALHGSFYSPKFGVRIETKCIKVDFNQRDSVKVEISWGANVDN